LASRHRIHLHHRSLRNNPLRKHKHNRSSKVQQLEKRKTDLEKKLDQLQEEGRKAGAEPAWFR